jgi:Ca2+-binding RTX toxin-like protein
VLDFGGNAGSGVVSSANAPIDTLAPTAVITLDHATLTAGQTALVTVTFSEPVTGFTNADLTVADGTLSTVSSADGGITFTSTFTPTAATFHDGDHITLNNPGVADIDGNPGVGTTPSGAYNVETGPAPSPPPPPPAPPSPPPPPAGGPETLTATTGDNTLSGGASGDMVVGSSGSDSMSGQGGADTLAGGDGNDFLQGNVGTDSVNGGTGDDKVYGGQGDDQVQGGPGNDFVSGDKGDDVVRGGQGDDSVAGGDGNDFLSGDLGSDTMTGGAGADTFHSFAGAGLDVVTDFSLAEGDRVELDPGTTFTTAQVGADTVITLTGPGGPGEMVLQGVQLSSLHGDWIFVE